MFCCALGRHILDLTRSFRAFFSRGQLLVHRDILTPCSSMATQRERDTAAAMRSQSSRSHEKQDSASQVEAVAEGSSAERKPHLHSKTYLAVVAVCAIYFVQIYNVVGTGAVRLRHLARPLGSVFTDI
jgi:hypothetical protein